MGKQKGNKKELEKISPGIDDLSGISYDRNSNPITAIKDAHAAGIGALGRSDDNQIEKLTVDEKNEDVY